MKRWKSLTAAFCAAVLLCGFSAVPAYAFADSGEGADYGDPSMTEETTAPEPEPTIEPGEGFSEEGNLVTRDLLYDEHTNKQFITVQTSGGATFYLVIDYDKPVDEEGEQYETYFLNMVDEADLLAAAEAAGVEQAVCSCSEKCEAGAVNTECAVCSVNKNKCAGVEPEPVETEPAGGAGNGRQPWDAPCGAGCGGGRRRGRVLFQGDPPQTAKGRRAGGGLRRGAGRL
jgi:hypothetical protein